jgi:hypothetical protein
LFFETLVTCIPECDLKTDLLMIERRSESNFADFAYLLIIRLGMEPNVETRLGAKTGEDFPDKVLLANFEGDV